MVWIWLSVVIVLLGADLNAEMEHQTARDSTEGTPKPLGTRGANMADHVGASHADAEEPPAPETPQACRAPVQDA